MAFCVVEFKIKFDFLQRYLKFIDEILFVHETVFDSLDKVDRFCRTYGRCAVKILCDIFIWFRFRIMVL